MTKTYKKLKDITLFVILFLPLFLGIVLAFHNSSNYDLNSLMGEIYNYTSFAVPSNFHVFQSLAEILGCEDSGFVIFLLLDYYLFTLIIRLVLDMFEFIFGLAHKFLNSD